MPDAAGARPGPGRPSTGARERILEAGLEVLKSDGYAGLTTSKVAARSGQNKALIGYHFGSKQGLVQAVARTVAERMTLDLLEAIGSPFDVRDLAEKVVEGLDGIMERDEGLARVYFDLASQSIVEPEVRSIMSEMKAGFRAVLTELLHGLGVKRTVEDGVAVYLIACLEGLALDRLERGETPELRRARALFVSTAPAVAGTG